MLVELDCL